MAAAGRNPRKVKVLVLAVVTAAAKAAGEIEDVDLESAVDAEAAVTTTIGGAMARGTGDRRRITTTRARTPRQRL